MRSLKYRFFNSYISSSVFIAILIRYNNLLLFLDNFIIITGLRGLVNRGTVKLVPGLYELGWVKGSKAIVFRHFYHENQFLPYTRSYLFIVFLLISNYLLFFARFKMITRKNGFHQVSHYS